MVEEAGDDFTCQNPEQSEEARLGFLGWGKGTVGWFKLATAGEEEGRRRRRAGHVT